MTTLTDSNHTNELKLAITTVNPGEPAPAPAKVRVQTERFGEIEVEEDLVIHFPDGLIGFERCTDYVVISNDDNSAFRWLQSLDEPTVAFPVLDPAVFRPDYNPSMPEADLRLLRISGNVPKLLFTIVTIPDNRPTSITANLLGPLVVNAMTRIGKQIIVQDDGFTTRHNLVEELNRAESMRTQENGAPAPKQVKEKKKSRVA